MRETAVQEILPRFRRLDDDEMWRKEAGSLATVADMAAEKRLSGALGKLVPGARILAEEDVETNPAALDYLADDDPLWVIDPIDGTANFAAGREGFVIIVAYFAGGEVRAFVRGGRTFSPGPDSDTVLDDSGHAWAVREEALRGPAGEEAPRIEGHLSYWFGWVAFHPKTLVYRGD